MSFPDPQSIVMHGVNTSFARMGTKSPDTLGEFRSADGQYVFNIRQNQSAGRFRREVRVTEKKTAADPISSLNKEVSASVILVFDEPKWGFNDTQLSEMMAALLEWYQRNSSAAAAKILAGET